MSDNFCIINTGGTFNKQYNQINGELEVKQNNSFIQDILKDAYKINKLPKIYGMIFKDSLEITKQDRKRLLDFIKKLKYKYIIVVHGTDTMSKTAKFLNKNIQNKTIILTGSMQPYSLSKVEPSANLMMSIGYINSNPKKNIYICMNGLIKKYNKISKNYKKAVFMEKSKSE